MEISGAEFFRIFSLEWANNVAPPNPLVTCNVCKVTAVALHRESAFTENSKVTSVQLSSVISSQSLFAGARKILPVHRLSLRMRSWRKGGPQSIGTPAESVAKADRLLDCTAIWPPSHVIAHRPD